MRERCLDKDRCGSRRARSGGIAPGFYQREGSPVGLWFTTTIWGKKEEADQRRCLGRSRGGLTTKVHAALDGCGRPLRITLTPGHRGDALQAPALLSGLCPRHVVADAAYDSDGIRQQVRQAGGKACIPPNPTRNVKKRYDRVRYRNRNVIERFFGRIKRFRRVATRYEKKAENYLGIVWLAAVLVCLR